MCEMTQLMSMSRASPDGDERAVAEDDGLIGDLQRLLEVVGDVDDRDPRRRQLTDDPEEHLDLVAREGRRRLVHDQDPRLARQRSRDLDHLLLTEPQVCHQCVGVEVLLEPLEELAGALRPRARLSMRDRRSRHECRGP